MVLVFVFCILRYKEKPPSNYEELGKEDESDDDLPIKKYPDPPTMALKEEQDNPINESKESEEKITEVDENLQLKFSLLFSKEDMFLMLNIIDLTGDLGKLGYKNIRINVTLLPEKKYRMKTKLIYLTKLNNENDVPVISIKENFRFSNITREKLFNSALRLRLYGKQKLQLAEKCLGEIIIHLADVAQRKSGYITVRNFSKVKQNTS